MKPVERLVMVDDEERRSLTTTAPLIVDRVADAVLKSVEEAVP